jgi:hypothetical protein
MRLVVERTFRMGAQRIALQGQHLRVRGIVTPYVPGQVVYVRVNHGPRRLAGARRAVRQVGGHGEFTLVFRASRKGVLRAAANVVHRAGQPDVQPAFARSVQAIVPFAGYGARGLRVRFLQQRLAALHFAGSRSGYYDDATARAVIAYRKLNRMPRNGPAGRQIFARLARLQGGFRVRYPRHGKHVEANLSRQVLALINPGGNVYRIIMTSSGKPSTPTVLGSFHVYSQTPGRNSHGMLHSNYFIGGYAIHGYPDVPTYPASHGCLRIPNANARFVMNWLNIGDRVDVYY